MCEIFLQFCVTVLLWGAQASTQHNLISSCPDVFQYHNDGQGFYGIIQTRSPPFGTRIMMSIKMSIDASLPKSNVGRLETLNDHDGVARSTLRFKVNFPLSSPLPIPTQIILNGQTICQGHAAFGPFHATMIKIDYSSSIEAIIQNGNTSGVPGYKKTNIVIRDVISYYHKEQDNPMYSFVVDQSKEYELIPNVKCLKKGNKFSRSKSNDEVSNNNGKMSDNRSTTSYQCGIPTVSPKPQAVDYGTPERGEWPWMVALVLRRNESLGFNCAGTLISSKHVATTAHCLYHNGGPVNANDLFVRVGVYDINDWVEEFAQIRGVQSIEFPPGHSREMIFITDNIGIVVFKKPVTFNRYIIPVCLWKGNTDLEEIVGRRGTILGWGKDEYSTTVTEYPGKIDVPIVSSEACIKSNFVFALFTTNRTFCAGERNGFGPCTGDLGGGLYLKRDGRWVIRGIISTVPVINRNENVCSLKDYVVYVDVAKYGAWIQGLINNSQ